MLQTSAELWTMDRSRRWQTNKKAKSMKEFIGINHLLQVMPRDKQFQFIDDLHAKLDQRELQIIVNNKNEDQEIGTTTGRAKREVHPNQLN